MVVFFIFLWVMNAVAKHSTVKIGEKMQPQQKSKYNKQNPKILTVNAEMLDSLKSENKSAHLFLIWVIFGTWLTLYTVSNPEKKINLAVGHICLVFVKGGGQSFLTLRSRQDLQILDKTAFSMQGIDAIMITSSWACSD